MEPHPSVQTGLPPCVAAIAPPARFRAWIESFFIYRGVAPRIILPNAAFDLVLAPGAGPHVPSSGFVHGYLSSAFAPPPMTLDAVGIRFRPGGLQMFLGIAPAEIGDGIADLLRLAPRRLIERSLSALCRTTDSAARLRTAEDLLDAMARPAPPSAAAVSVVTEQLATSRVRSVAALARETRLSARRVERLMHEHFGVSPKTAIRLQRFRSAMWLRIRRHLAWAEAAVAAGYYDQAHFTNECSRIAGVAPGTLERLLDASAAYRL